MLCESCKTDMFIADCSYEAEGDSSPDTKTMVYYRPIFACINHNCHAFQKRIDGERVKLM